LLLHLLYVGHSIYRSHFIYIWRLSYLRLSRHASLAEVRSAALNADLNWIKTVQIPSI